MWDYTDKVMEHFKNPRNVGEIENPDAVGEVGSIVCGDVLKLTLKINPENHLIEDAKFKTFGCASAIASSSVLTEMIKGKTVEEAARITNKEIADYLGGLPEQKMHCSVMGMEALQAAIENYYTKKGIKVFPGEQEKIICKCFSVSEKTILKAIELNGLKTVEQVTDYTKAGGNCGQCRGEIEKILKDYWARQGQLPFQQLTTVEKIKLIERILEEEINPKLRQDGGWLELVDLEGQTVKVRFLGACSGCQLASQTFKEVVEKALREKAAENLEIVLL
ncbi:MAG TPA: Fe-S cluster assembly protein NifU [Candidatus Saccharicenans sp.]|nr:Fe-S cluster assembly protein NifU [Candidatus Saccharicenans sp.]HQM74423.1 Fe-S cluster assembly protein NifU [Candidatus Saccharicenans sp.]